MGDSHYEIKFGNNLYKRHVDQIRATQNNQDENIQQDCIHLSPYERKTLYYPQSANHQQEDQPNIGTPPASSALLPARDQRLIEDVDPELAPR